MNDTSPRPARAPRLLLSCAGLLIACALSACGGDSGSTSVSTPAATQTPTPAGTATAPTPAASDAALKADMRCAP